MELTHYLTTWSAGDDRRSAVAQAVVAIAGAAASLAKMIARGPLEGALGGVVGDNADGDQQKELDLRANDLYLAALRRAPVALLASEENETVLVLDPAAPLAVAIDPLDGSSNIDTNVSIGTIFSILPSTPAIHDAAEQVALQAGANQLAAGFVIYGPQTALVLTLGAGSHIFTLDVARGAYVLTRENATIPPGKREYAINASNYRHWDEPVRDYIDDCMAGETGPRGESFNMRWIASLVAEAFRILARGGIFLYPRDDRPGYQNGRLRLVYEANPIAFVVEQAGGGASDGERRIMEIEPATLHQRVPLVFGPRDDVDQVTRYHKAQHLVGARAPLFARRGLFRA